MLHGVVGRHKHGVVSPRFEQVVHGRAFVARARLFQKLVVIAKVGIVLYEVGYCASREDIKVRVVHFVGTRYVHEHTGRKGQETA